VLAPNWENMTNIYQQKCLEAGSMLFLCHSQCFYTTFHCFLGGFRLFLICLDDFGVSKTVLDDFKYASKCLKLHDSCSFYSGRQNRRTEKIVNRLKCTALLIMIFQFLVDDRMILKNFNLGIS
jgi:hypothetical protein